MLLCKKNCNFALNNISTMFQAFFFDMDGVLFDSMPNHILAWSETLAKYGIPFTPRDCYLNEGRTSRDVILLLAKRHHITVAEDQLEVIYQEKTASYRRRGGGKPMKDIDLVLYFLARRGSSIWVVTGGGQTDLHEQLEGFFPGIFQKEKMITAFDYTNGKPHPEPYLTAWERSGLKKEQCCVVENAPLGIQAGKAAGLFTIGVNTGELTREDLEKAGADIVLDNMAQLHEWLLKQQ